MSAITLDRLRRLKVLLRGQDLVDYSWWSDEVMKRIPLSLPLHYQLQDDPTCKSFNSTCKDDLCLLNGLKFFFAKLMSSGYPVNWTMPTPKYDIPRLNYPQNIIFSPADCVKYLVVLISDLHHPLHFDLTGANSIALLPGLCFC